MSTVAEQLRLAREAKSFSIHQVAEITKIRTDHIRALEEGNFNAFSAPVYIRGFVRTYAGLLKLDVPLLMTALDEELGRTEKFREPPPLTEQSGGALNFITLQLSKLNWRITAALVGGLVVLLVVIVSINAARHRQSANPLANVPDATVQSAQSGDTLPLPTNAPHR